jgi:peptidyl-prolyl cis-trans isomerase SurA
MTFAEAALKFSDDDATKNNGGLMQNQQDGSTKIPTDQLDPNIYFQIENMKVGEIAQATLFKTASGDQQYRMIQYVSKTDPHQANLKDDYQKIQQAAMSNKQNKVMADWFKKKRGTTFIRINDEYKSCEILTPWFNESANALKK